MGTVFRDAKTGKITGYSRKNKASKPQEIYKKSKSGRGLNVYDYETLEELNKQAEIQKKIITPPRLEVKKESVLDKQRREAKLRTIQRERERQRQQLERIRRKPKGKQTNTEKRLLALQDRSPPNKVTIITTRNGKNPKIEYVTPLEYDTRRRAAWESQKLEVSLLTGYLHRKKLTEAQQEQAYKDFIRRYALERFEKKRLVQGKDGKYIAGTVLDLKQKGYTVTDLPAGLVIPKTFTIGETIRYRRKGAEFTINPPTTKAGAREWYKVARKLAEERNKSAIVKLSSAFYKDFIKDFKTVKNNFNRYKRENSNKQLVISGVKITVNQLQSLGLGFLKAAYYMPFKENVAVIKKVFKQGGKVTLSELNSIRRDVSARRSNDKDLQLFYKLGRGVILGAAIGLIAGLGGTVGAVGLTVAGGVMLPFIAKDIFKQAATQGITKTAFDNILEFGVGFGIGNKISKGFIKLGSKANPRYIPAVKNVELIKTELLTRLKGIRAARKLARISIREGYEVAANKRFIKSVDKLETQINKIIKDFNMIIRDKKILKLEGTNPFVETKKLMRVLNKEKEIFHATSVKPNKLFGNKFQSLKKVNEVLKAVEKNTLKTGRAVKGKGEIAKTILKVSRQLKGVITGGKAQNVWVKKLLQRKTGDYDIFFKNPRSAAVKVIAALKRVGYKNVVFKRTKTIGGGYVYRIKINNKVVADFDPLPKDLKYKKVGNDLVATAEFLARRKLGTIKDVRKTYRLKKDIKDLRRLTGALFSNKKFANKLRSPKNWFTVTPQPAGMGADRIRFGETQMFFDFTVPTNYAYQSLGRETLGKMFINLLDKAPVKSLVNRLKTVNPFFTKRPQEIKSGLLQLSEFKTAFLEQLGKLPFIKGRVVKPSDRFLVLKLKARIQDLPPALKSRVKKASKGLLNSKQSNALRRDLNKWINNNLNKVNIGSRTGSKVGGERELTLSVGSQPKAEFKSFGKGVKRKFSIDPETNLLFDVIEVGFKQVKKPIPKRIKDFMKAFKFEPIKTIKRRFFLKGDYAKIKRIQRILKRADKLSSGDKRDFLYVMKRLFSSKKAQKLMREKVKEKRTRGRDRVKVKKPKTRIRARDKPQTKRRVRSKVKVSRARDKLKLRRSRSVKRARTKTRARVRARTRTRNRTRLKARKRTKTRARRKVRARERTRPRPRNRPRTRPRPRVRARLTTRQRSRLNQLIRRGRTKFKVILSLKRRTKKDVKKILKWIRKQPRLYRPSLAAVLLNIMGKIPKRVSGMEILPILKK